MHWTDELHSILLKIAGAINRPDIDAKFVADAGVKLDSALFPLLSRIGTHGPMGVVDLAAECGRDHSTVSRQIDQLEAMELIERRTSPKDRRVKLLNPSDKGNAILKALSKFRRKQFQSSLAEFTEEERQILLRCLRKLSRHDSDGAQVD